MSHYKWASSEEDSRIPIILGQPFLSTAGAMIDVKNGKLFLQVGDEKVEFSLPQVIVSPTSSDRAVESMC